MELDIWWPRRSPWSLFRELEETGRQFDSLFGTPFLPAIWNRLPTREREWSPAVEVIEKEDLPGRSAEMGTYFMEKLRKLDNPHIVEIRGRGLFIGLELDEPARPYCEALQEEGLLCKETHEHVIRFAPPLVIEKEDLDWAFERIEKVMEG